MSDSNDTPRQPAPLATSFAGRTVKPGDLVSGRIVKITGNVAFVDYGARSEGYVELGELKGEDGQLILGEGDPIEVEVVGTRGAVHLSYRKALAGQIRESLREAWRKEQPVEGRIVAVNKGGFEVRIQGIRAFCPLSQISEGFPREPAREVGKTYTFRITEYGEGKSLVVSRRALIEAERQAARATIGDRVRVGDRLQGKVTQLKDFGAFVDLGDGLEGLIHISEVSHARVEHPRDRFTTGEAVEVVVVKVDTERGRVGLSTKRLEQDPWSAFVDELEVGKALTGTVDRLQPFGAFIKLADGVDGLLHVSGITTERRIEHPNEVLESGKTIEVVVEKIDRDRKRIGLLTPEVAEQRKPVAVNVKRGDTVKGPVTRVERYGVFIEIEAKVVGLIPNAEMDTSRGADHMRMFPVGTEIEAKVIEVDKQRNRIRLSRKALKNAAEEKALADFRKREKAPQSLGTFGDLLKDFLSQSKS